MGADRVVLGTDDPFDMGEDNPVDRLAEIRGLSTEERHLILGGNAQRLYRKSL